MTQLQCNVPFIIEVVDYHDFDMLADAFQQLCPQLRCVEVCGPVPGLPTYLGLVYIYGSKPNPTQVKQLIEVYNG